MAISLLPTVPSRSMAPATFTSTMDAFLAALPGFVSDTNNVAANLNSIAAGGAYAMPYTFSSSASEVDPGTGKLGLSSTPQSSSIALRVNLTNSASIDMTSLLNDFTSSTSSVPGTVRIQKVGDITKWLTFNVTSAVDYTGYKRLNVAFRGGSTASPFTAGDALVLYFQRTGDKGDQGVAGNSSNLILVGSYTVSTAVASINFLSLFTSTYDKYIIEVQGLTTSAGAALLLRLAKAGVVDTSAAYANAVAGSISSGATSFNITASTVSATAARGLSCTINVRNVNASSDSSVDTHGFYQDNSGTLQILQQLGMYSGGAAASGFSLLPASGNFTAGIVRVFGVKNT